MHLEVVDRHGRQTLHEVLPIGTAVGGYVCAHVRSHEEQVRVVGIFLDDVDEIHAHRRQPVHDGTECAAPIIGHEDVGSEVVRAVVVHRDVEPILVVVRRLHPGDVTTGGHAGQTIGELGPAPTVIPGHPEASIVGACVEPALPERRLIEGHHRCVGLGTRDIRGDSARRLQRDMELLGIVVRQIG